MQGVVIEKSVNRVKFIVESPVSGYAEYILNENGDVKRNYSGMIFKKII